MKIMLALMADIMRKRGTYNSGSSCGSKRMENFALSFMGSLKYTSARYVNPSNRIIIESNEKKDSKINFYFII